MMMWRRRILAEYEFGGSAARRAAANSSWPPVVLETEETEMEVVLRLQSFQQVSAPTISSQNQVQKNRVRDFTRSIFTFVHRDECELSLELTETNASFHCNVPRQMELMVEMDGARHPHFRFQRKLVKYLTAKPRERDFGEV